MENRKVFSFPNHFVIIMKICGVLPLTYSFQLTKLNYLYSFFLLVVFVTVQLTSIPAVTYFEYVKTPDYATVVTSMDRGSIITRFVKEFYPVIMSAPAVVSVINALCLSQTYLPKYLNHLRESNGFLKVSDEFMKRHKEFSSLFIKWSLGLSIPVKLLSVGSLIMLHVINGFVLSWVFALYFADTTAFVAEIQFILMCNFLRLRFKELNKALEDTFLLHEIKLEYRMRTFALNWNGGDVSKDNKQCEDKGFLNSLYAGSKCCKKNKSSVKDPKKATPIFVVPLEKAYFSENEATFLYKDFANVTKTSYYVHKADFSKEVHNLRLCHRHLSIALKHLKKLFEYVLLMSLFTSFLMILLNVYFVIYGFVKVFILSDRFDVLFWIAKSLFRYACPLILCDLTAKEARKTLELLGGYASQTLTKDTEDEIDYFCREISSRDLTITCAFNLFDLNIALLTAAAAASTTYIVILVQLH